MKSTSTVNRSNVPSWVVQQGFGKGISRFQEWNKVEWEQRRYLSEISERWNESPAQTNESYWDGWTAIFRSLLFSSTSNHHSDQVHNRTLQHVSDNLITYQKLRASYTTWRWWSEYISYLLSTWWTRDSSRFLDLLFKIISTFSDDIYIVREISSTS